MLDRLKEGLQEAVRKLIGAPSVDKEVVREFVKDLQRALLQADVNVKLVLDLTSRIEKRALEEKPPPGLLKRDHVVTILYEELSKLLGVEGRLEPPVDGINTILTIGVQGSGKTTTVAKLGRALQRRGYKVGIVCADTFRPGALTQLQMLVRGSNIGVYGQDGMSDAVKVAVEGVRQLQSQGMNVIVIDTAGRHKEEKGLLEEMKRIAESIQPSLTLLVIDGTIGQQAYAQAEAFHHTTPVGGIIISKLDGAAKGGGALAAVAATGAPIYFIGSGERVDDLETFSPTRFVGRLLGMGDLKALLERAKELEAEADAEKLQRIVSGKMTIDDLYYQLEQVKKLGSLKKILELIPGLSGAIPEANLEDLEVKLKNWKSIIQSMTRSERADPESLNSSMIRRIARGSGSSERDVKEMIQRYRQTKALMKASRGRGFRQLLKRLQPGLR